jgi:hypothetical protein
MRIRTKSGKNNGKIFINGMVCEKRKGIKMRKDVRKVERRMNNGKTFINGKMSEKWKGVRNAERRKKSGKTHE